MNAKECCNREVLVISKDQTPLDAARLMRQHHIGSVVIVEECNGGKRPVGLVTDRDIAIEVVAEEVDPNEVSVLDITRRPLMLANESDALSDCLTLMKQKGVRRLPIVDAEGILVGILSLDDIVELVAEQLNDLVSLIKHQPQKEQSMTV